MAANGMKTCIACLHDFPCNVQFFHKCKITKSGFEGRCKRCRKIQSDEWRMSKRGFECLRLKRQSAYQKQRRVEAHHKWYINNRRKIQERRKLYYEARREIYRARSHIRWLIKSGEIVLPKYCQHPSGCSSTQNLIARFPFVDRPTVQLRFWCKPCCGKHDAQYIRADNSSTDRTDPLFCAHKEWISIHNKNIVKIERELGVEDLNYVKKVKLFRERFRPIVEAGRRAPRFADLMMLQALVGIVE